MLSLPISLRRLKSSSSFSSFLQSRLQMLVIHSYLETNIVQHLVQVITQRGPKFLYLLSGGICDRKAAVCRFRSLPRNHELVKLLYTWKVLVFKLQLLGPMQSHPHNSPVFVSSGSFIQTVTGPPDHRQ